MNEETCEKQLHLAQTSTSKPHTSHFVKRGRGRPPKENKCTETKNSEERNEETYDEQLHLAQTSTSTSTSEPYTSHFVKRGRVTPPMENNGTETKNSEERNEETYDEQLHLAQTSTSTSTSEPHTSHFVKRGRVTPPMENNGTETKNSEERNEETYDEQLHLAQTSTSTSTSEPHTSHFVKRGRGRPPKQNNQESTETENSEERNLLEEAYGEELLLAQTSTSNSTSDDFSALNSNALDVAFDQVEIVPPLDDQLVLTQNLELYPVPRVDTSRSSMAFQHRYFPLTTEKIGFFGLGLIGQRIVKLFLDSGLDVSVCNRTPDKCKPFVDAGAKQHLTPADLILNCDIIFCCVSGPHAVESFLYGDHGILKGLETCRPGTKGYVELTSMDPQCSRAVAEAINSRGGTYLEAAIIGSRSIAEERHFLNFLSRGGIFISRYTFPIKNFFMKEGKEFNLNLRSVFKGTAKGFPLAEAMD
ncbi:oxidoreductase GLYR1-like protein [Trichonephila inaurata madagascariensis]|uniref:Oxidoreductase GLYR1-like protein n=1 Tax=Trichonephila inaurata madagascariensis TaxID=2747483 RepID=A0A8X7CMF7_9ARAC|nr:oxidoreductase GLYR1-like protein [Trichonephila inaurata madagascariensis]